MPQFVDAIMKDILDVFDIACNQVVILLLSLSLWLMDKMYLD